MNMLSLYKITDPETRKAIFAIIANDGNMDSLHPVDTDRLECWLSPAHGFLVTHTLDTPDGKVIWIEYIFGVQMLSRDGIATLVQLCVIEGINKILAIPSSKLIRKLHHRLGFKDTDDSDGHTEYLIGG